MTSPPICPEKCRQCMFIKGIVAKPRKGKAFKWIFSCSNINVKELSDKCDHFHYDVLYQELPFNRKRHYLEKHANQINTRIRKMGQANLLKYGLKTDEKTGQVESTSNYPATLKATDIGDKLGDAITVTIIDYEEVVFNAGKETEEDKIVLGIILSGHEKDEDEGKRRFILNKTNLERLCNKLGTDFDKWVTKKVDLHRENCKYGKDTVDCTRVAF